MTQRCSNRGPARRASCKWRAAVGLSAVVAVASGCYTYQPLDEGPVPRQPETIRVELTGAGEDAMMAERGIRLEVFEGRVLEEAGDELTMEVRLPANLLAFSDRAVTDTLSVLRPHVRTLDVKQFSTGKTVAATAAGVAAGALLYAVIDAAVSDDDATGGEGDNIDFSVVPLVTTLLGWLR